MGFSALSSFLFVGVWVVSLNGVAFVRCMLFSFFRWVLPIVVERRPVGAIF